jgi:hypothetical protein
VQRRGEVVVALHAGAVAGDGRHGDAVTRSDRRAVEAMACHQHQSTDTGGGGGAARLGDASNGETGGFRLAGKSFEFIDLRHFRIDEVERRQFARQKFPIGEPGKAILRRRTRHGDGALGQGVKPVALEVVGRNHRLLAADDDAQAEIVALGALGFLDGAVAHLDRKRHRTHGERVGLIGAGATRGGH